MASSATDTTPGSGWQVGGWVLFTLGVFGLFVSFLMDTTVDVRSTGVFDVGVGEVVNLDLLFRKGVAITVNLFVMGAGLLCAATGTILERLS